MKTLIRSTITALLVTVICTTIGCKKSRPSTNGESELFKKETTNYGAYNGSRSIIEFQTDQSQIVYNNKYSFFAIQNNDQTKYIYAYLGQNVTRLVVEDKFTVNITSKGLAELSPNQTVSMEVLQIEGDKMWLWSYDISIGLIVKIQ